MLNIFIVESQGRLLSNSYRTHLSGLPIDGFNVISEQWTRNASLRWRELLFVAKEKSGVQKQFEILSHCKEEYQIVIQVSDNIQLRPIFALLSSTIWCTILAYLRLKFEDLKETRICLAQQNRSISILWFH